MIELYPVKCGFIIYIQASMVDYWGELMVKLSTAKRKKYLILHRNNSDNDYKS